MYVKKDLMLWLAVCALAIPLLLAGTASARYVDDGAVQDGVTGGWKSPTDGICVLGLKADGTMLVDATITTARDCQARLIAGVVAANGGTGSAVCTDPTKNTEGIKYAAAGSSTCVTIDGSGIVTGAISLKDLDRSAAICQAKGGYLANNAAVAAGQSICIAYGWQYRGQDADGTPLSFGAEGTAAGTTGAGFCYTSMTTGIDVAACPSLSTDVRTKFGYSVSGSNCNYAYGINGPLSANKTAIDGTVTTAGTVVDLSGFSMGDCLAGAYTWNNWVAKDSTTTTTNGATIATFDHNRQASGSDREGCLHCHSNTSQANGPTERWKESYLKTGHKNMLRKVTAGKNWAGPDGTVYTAHAEGPLNFLNATATVSEGADKPLLYIFGEWMAAAPAGLDVIVDMSGAAKYNGGSNYSCAPCHTTGWSNTATATAGLCSISSNVTEAACTTAGGTWVPTTGTQGVVGQEPGASFPGITFTGSGNWDLDGIQCTRCHGSVYPTPTGLPSHEVAVGGHQNDVWNAGSKINNLCYGCHQSPAKTANGTGVDIDTANPQNIPVKLVGSDREFNGHVIGNSFLNSPHAKFTGTITPNLLGKWDIATGTYASAFKGYGCYQGASSSSPAITKADGSIIHSKAECEALYGAGAWKQEIAAGSGSCTTCHDVHNSLFVEGQTHHPIRRECETCHEDTAGNGYATAGVPQLEGISHPTTTATPGDTAMYGNACEVCHMPKATSGGFPMHLWRINTDATYSTFPSVDEFNAGMKIANAAADGAYDGAVWVDLDLACGTCHNGSVTEAPVFTKAQMAISAATMHSGATTTIGRDNGACLTCHTAIVPGTNHHGVHSDCIDCHGTVANPLHSKTVPDQNSNAFCLTCHTNTGAHAVHHAVPGLSATCVSCHTIPGVTVPEMITTDRTSVTNACQMCHATAQGTKRALVVSGTGDNHHRGSGTQLRDSNNVTVTDPALADPKFSRDVAGCLYCHGLGKPFSNAATEVMQDQRFTGSCSGACHVGVVQTAAVTPTAPQNHHDGTCMSCHAPTSLGAAGVTTPAFPPATWADCTACHSTVAINRAVMPASADPTLGTPICAKCHEASGLVSGSTVTNYLGVQPNVQVACGQCHGGADGPAGATASYQNLITLTSMARSIHGAAPVAGLTASADATTDYSVIFNASSSFCPSTCDISISFGDGSTYGPVVLSSATATTSHVYADATSRTATLTITAAGGGSDSKSVTVTPKYVASTPTAVSIASAPVSGSGVTVNYALSGGNGPYTVKATWGDGTTETAAGVAGPTNSVAHTFASAGTYTVTITATDSGVNGGYVTTGTANTRVTVGAGTTYTISGLVTRVNGTTPVASASLRLQLNGVTKKVTYTNASGAFTFTGVAPGAYTATVAKGGLTFGPPTSITVIDANVTGVTISSTN